MQNLQSRFALQYAYTCIVCRRNVTCVIETYDVINIRGRQPENRWKNNSRKNNRIRFLRRWRRWEVTSQCDRLGNESRRLTEMAKAVAAKGILRQRGFRRNFPLCRGRLWRTTTVRLTDTSTFSSKILERNSLSTS